MRTSLLLRFRVGLRFELGLRSGVGLSYLIKFTEVKKWRGMSNTPPVQGIGILKIKREDSQTTKCCTSSQVPTLGFVVGCHIDPIKGNRVKVRVRRLFLYTNYGVHTYVLFYGSLMVTG